MPNVRFELLALRRREHAFDVIAELTARHRRRRAARGAELLERGLDLAALGGRESQIPQGRAHPVAVARRARMVRRALLR